MVAYHELHEAIIRVGHRQESHKQIDARTRVEHELFDSNIEGKNDDNAAAQAQHGQQVTFLESEAALALVVFVDTFPFAVRDFLVDRIEDGLVELVLDAFVRSLELVKVLGCGALSQLWRGELVDRARLALVE